MFSVIDKILGKDMYKFANHLMTHASDDHTHRYSTKKIKAGMGRLKEYLRKFKINFQ